MDQKMNESVSGRNSKNASLSSKMLDKVDYFYAITIKPTFNSYIKKVCLDDRFLRVFIQNWVSKHKVTIVGEICLEKDCLQILHAHFTIKHHLSTFRNFSWKGWHIYSESIFDLSGWVGYIHKDMPKIEYSFLDDN